MSANTTTLDTVSQTTSPKRSPIGKLRRVTWRTILAMIDMETSLRCAGVAFFGFLSLFPALSLGVLLFGLLANRSMLTGLLDRLDGLMPDMAIALMHDQLSQLVSQPPATLGLGIVASLLFALWSGSRGMDALLFAASRTRKDPNKRPFYISLLIAIAVTLIGGIALFIALGLVAALPAFFNALPFFDGSQLLFLRWPLLMVLSIIAFAALYRYGPDRRPKKGRWIWPGAVLAALGWLLVCLVFSLYVEHFANFEKSFGSVSAAVVLMLWMYNSAQVVILGAAFNAQLEYESLAEHPQQSPGPKGKLPG